MHSFRAIFRRRLRGACMASRNTALHSAGPATWSAWSARRHPGGQDASLAGTGKMRRFWIILGFGLIAVCASGQKRDRVGFEVAGLFHSNQFTLEASPSQPLVMRAADREFVIGQSGRQRVAMTRVGQRVSLHIEGTNLTVNSVWFSGKSGDAEFTLLIPSRFCRRYRGELNVSSTAQNLFRSSPWISRRPWRRFSRLKLLLRLRSKR